MYYFIDEDGNITKSTSEPTDADLKTADDGIMQIINGSNDTQYYNGYWVSISQYIHSEDDDVEEEEENDGDVSDTGEDEDEIE